MPQRLWPDARLGRDEPALALRFLRLDGPPHRPGVDRPGVTRWWDEEEQRRARAAMDRPFAVAAWILTTAALIAMLLC